MILKILLPSEILVNEEVTKVTAEAVNGSFCILPRHIDFVASLVPGILTFEQHESETFVAVDEGVLIKVGVEVLVSTKNAVKGAHLEDLRMKVEDDFLSADERKKKATTALANLEANLVRKFLEINKT